MTQCVLDDKKICARKAITNDYIVIPVCITISFENTASDCFENKEVS